MPPLANSWAYTETHVKGDLILSAFRNEFRVVSVRPYVDKKGALPDGLNLTLLVMHDDHDYGIDKNGNPRENNEFQTFDVTVLTRDHPVKKGDFIRLLDFDAEHSYAIGFNLLLRFRGLEVLPGQTGGETSCGKSKPTV